MRGIHDTELLGGKIAVFAGISCDGVAGLPPLAQGDLAPVDILLPAGADPNEITRIDDLDTALTVADVAGHTAVGERLRPLTARLP